ncbi:hypothetical protein D915_010486 [Fasciola hepatica]|uniref:Uncharacterized protein n=1 Tax=Fasciola hepatica TaxID=6192 RepID=A0A4E0RPQ4_FASHE|nr:hypothetical protein D915_010486 [Fasciola hepatica]
MGQRRHGYKRDAGLPSSRSSASIALSTMAGGPELNQEVFTGWRHYFNTVTQKGRANIVFATYASVFVAYLAFRRRSRRKADLELAKLAEK